jgi:hypothetical protein
MSIILATTSNGVQFLPIFFKKRNTLTKWLLATDENGDISSKSAKLPA